MESKIYDAKIEIREATNKKGDPYKLLLVHMEASNGEMINVLDMYLKPSVYDIITFITKQKEGGKPIE